MGDPLTDGVVVLRPWRETDACVHEALDDPRLAERVAAEDVSFAVARADTDEAVGLVAVHRAPQDGVGGLVCWLAPAHRGRGLAKRAVWLVTAHALADLGFARVEAWVQPSDKAGAGVLNGCGFLREGLLRSFLVVDGLRVDVHVYSRIARR